MATASSFLTSLAPARDAAAGQGELGFFARLMQSFQDARMRQAEREVARLIESRGGRLTDAVERQISKHFV